MNNKLIIKKLEIIENILRLLENGIIKLNRKIIKDDMAKIIEENIFSARWGLKNLINKLADDIDE